MSSPVVFYVACFNRVIGLQSIYEYSLRSKLEVKLIILDMGSTWPPFIEYRDSLGIEVVFIDSSIGPRDLWSNSFILESGPGGFFFADGDLLYDDLPDDALCELVQLSETYPWFPKVGFSLKLSDLPRDQESVRVIEWESDNWRVPFGSNSFICSLDTTIAYYPRREKSFYYRPALRTQLPYEVIHYPWYEREGSLTPEAEFYRRLAKSRISSTQAGLWPTQSYKIKHKFMLIGFKFTKYFFTRKFSGRLFVKLFSTRGRID